MREPLRILLEAIVLCACGAGVGLVANVTRAEADRLELGHDYYAAVPVKPAGAAPIDIERAARERLQAAGITVLEHDDVVKLYEDELYREGAFVFVDARNAAQFAAGHIPGAWLLDHYHPKATIDRVMPQVQTAAQVVIYCSGKDCTDSELCALLLKNHGADPAVIGVYLGGYAQWTQAGLPIEQGERAP